MRGSLAPVVRGCRVLRRISRVRVRGRRTTSSFPPSLVARPLWHHFRGRQRRALPVREFSSLVQARELQRRYYEHMSSLLDAESTAHESAAFERASRWSTERQVREGYALVGLEMNGKPRVYLDNIIMRFSRNFGARPAQSRKNGGEGAGSSQRGGPPLPFHRFTNGDAVLVSLFSRPGKTGNKKKDKAGKKSSDVRGEDAAGAHLCSGVVVGTGTSWIEVATTDTPPRDTHGPFRLDLGADTVSIERIKAGLGDFAETASGSGFSGPTWLQELIIDGYFSPGRAALRALEEGSRDESISGAGGAHSFMSEKWVLDLLRDRAEKAEILNQSQIQGMLTSLSHKVSLVQGPPGTGKTTLLAHLLATWKRTLPQLGPALAVASSNVAVDQLAMSLLKLSGGDEDVDEDNAAGLGSSPPKGQESRENRYYSALPQDDNRPLRIVRVGRAVRVNEALQAVTLDVQIAKHPKMRALRSRRGQSTRAEERALAARLEAKILREADVVCSTCVGCGSSTLNSHTFNLVVVDEASQVTEPEALVPLNRMGRDAQLLLVGDQHQLPPTVLSSRRQRGVDVDPDLPDLSLSLFQRLANIISSMDASAERQSQAQGASGRDEPLPLAATMLDIQYRMHPGLAEWPSREFYDGRLMAGVAAEDRGLLPSEFQWPNANIPVAFVPVPRGAEAVQEGSSSKYNNEEAKAVAGIVRALLAGDVKEDDIAAKREADDGQAVDKPVDVQLEDESDSACFEPGDIGVVTPYRAQTREISQCLRENKIRLAGRVALHLAESGEAPVTRGVEVHTVDGYQGREKDIIVLSCVRANGQGEVGFLSDYRRLNVAITRARRGLVVVGHEDTLAANDQWLRWLVWAAENKLYAGPSRARRVAMARKAMREVRRRQKQAAAAESVV